MQTTFRFTALQRNFRIYALPNHAERSIYSSYAITKFFLFCAWHHCMHEYAKSKDGKKQL